MSAPTTHAVSDFGNDASHAGLRHAASAYIGRLRTGDAGVMPALCGLVLLCAIFTFTKPTFLTDLNFANLLQQSAWLVILAMGITFVLLIGEIDLAAGSTMGVTLAITYLHAKQGVGGGLRLLVALACAGAIALFVWVHLRRARRPPLQAIGVAVLGGAAAGVPLGLLLPNVVVAVLLGMVVGVAMGAFTGLLVAKVGIPSFVVTLALFLAWQGMLLRIAGEGGSIRIDNRFLQEIGNRGMRPVYGWVLAGLVIGGYAAAALWRRHSRIRKGVAAQPLALVLLKIGAVAAGWGYATYRLNLNRATPNVLRPLQGVPRVVPLILVLVLVLTFLLDRTAWGRHLYAVGGNAEAARRAGINVARVRLSAFAVVGLLASFAGIVYGSRVGSVTPQTGAGTELLNAVGAAVVGGVSLFGGRGKMVYAVVGGLVLATIDNGLGLYKRIAGFDVNAGLKLIVAGSVLLLAGSVDALTRRSASTR